MAHPITTFTKGGTHTVEFAHPFLFKNHLFATEAEAHAALAALDARCCPQLQQLANGEWAIWVYSYQPSPEETYIPQ